ncbi:MAG: DUF3857 domain-containing protein [bacterium]|nr:DUF3857 domain-containing protein [bacterium]
MLKVIVAFLVFGRFEYIVELDSTYEAYYESGISERFEYRRIKVLGDEIPEELRALEVTYTPYYNTADFEFVRIVRGRDTLYLDTEDVVDVLAPPDLGGTIFWGERKKVLEIKDLRKGDILESKVKKYGGNWLGPTGEEKYKTPYPGYFNQIVLFGETVPVKKKLYLLEEIAEKPIKFGIFNGKIKHRIITKDGKKIHMFYSKNIKPYKVESLSPSIYDFVPKLIVTNIPSWKEMSRIEFQRAEPNVTPDETIKKFADSLCSGIIDDDEKIRRLFYFVADEIRYLGLIESEMEGYEPHPAWLTLQKRSGVCKDKAALLVALLRAKGFKAYYATTAVGMRVENIPADQTNHAIVVLERGKDYEFLDPTIGAGGRDLLPASEGGQSVLVSRAEGDTLRTIPVSTPEKNKVSIYVYTTLLGDTVYFSYLMNFNGAFDQRLRRVAQSGRRRVESFLHDILSGVYSGIVVIDSIRFTDPKDYSEYFRIRVSGRVLKAVINTPDFKLYRPVSSKLASSFAYFLRHLNSKRELDLVISFPQSYEVKEFVPLAKVVEPFKNHVRLGKEQAYIFEFEAGGIVDQVQNVGNFLNTEESGGWFSFSTSLVFSKKKYSSTEAESMFRDYQSFQGNENLWLPLKGE